MKVVNFCLQVTSESFIDGGFFKTGDTVTLDEEGYFIILGRKYRFTRMHTYFFSACYFHQVMVLLATAWGEFWIASSLIYSFVLTYAGTNADIMKVGGYKLSALEIEAVLLEVTYIYTLETTFEA